MKPELIVALDVPTAADAFATMDRLPPEVRWYKIGLELFCAEGPDIVIQAEARGKKIFLDLKLHDIPRTVERAVKAAARYGASLLTVHAAGGRSMLKAAVEAARSCDNPPRLVAVTLLTSLDPGDLHDLGIGRSPSEQALAMAQLALNAGIDGLVSSPQEVEKLRATFGPDPLLVTPGIRPASGDTGDQKRVGTPAMAVRAGSTHLVVGRPILEAPDPAAAALDLLREMQ